MKITVGTHEVDVKVEGDAGKPVLCFKATVGETVRENRMTLHPKHDHTAEQLQKDIQAHAQLLAEEAAGHEQSRVLIADLLLRETCDS